MFCECMPSFYSESVMYTNELLNLKAVGYKFKFVTSLNTQKVEVKVLETFIFIATIKKFLINKNG